MTEWTSIASKSPRYGIGLMSGSSCDGIDAALVRIKGTGENLALKLIAHSTFPYSPGFRTRLLGAHPNSQELCALDFLLGERFGDAARAMMDTAEMESIHVDFVASHGHTIAHHPPPSNQEIGTLQIGEPALIAERTGLPVVSDFRPRDMAVGGQGAPLVPYADWVLFHKLKHRSACLNIGGIANFTVVTDRLDDIIAFDTGPGNMVIDGAARFLSKGKLVMDEDGKLAKRGMLVQELLDLLMSHPYFERVPPKSTGHEEFGLNVYLRDALASRAPDYVVEDLMATVTETVARSIVAAYNRFIEPLQPVEHVIVSGGGANNKTLMRKLSEGLPELKFFTSDDYGIPSAAREAIAFAILGNETLCGTPSNVPSATGARSRVLLGKITPP